ncbi:MAG TPA: ABC transporter ATP-binding protein [Thermoleophilaceae bacterium]|nr:ABC transporter ATP-binding protein [Thermoleophilaceae bacterium]
MSAESGDTHVSGTTRPSAVKGGASAPPFRLLDARGISKGYGRVQANEAVDFDVQPGEIHALLGENGAGKSTLMNILFGHVAPDEGQLRVRGEPVTLRSPHDAMAHGIGLVHQHFSLVPTLTVAENVALGSPPSTRLVLKRREIEAQVEAAAESLGWSFDLDRAVGDLPVEAQQRVEILKVLAPQPEVLLFDEPTALLAPPEVASLLDVLRRLRARGKGIVLVTHRLAEVVAVADRVTVLRDGRRISTQPVGKITERELGEAVAGGHIAPPPPPSERRIDRSSPVIRLEQVVCSASRGHRALDALDLEVSAGEIVGIAGVEGNGQQELFEVLTGLSSPDSGCRRLNGVDVNDWDTRAMRRAGLGMVPADRKGSGIVGKLSVTENLALGQLAGGTDEDASIKPWRRSAGESRVAELIEAYDIRPADAGTHACTLSGGNQQKLLLARELSREPIALVASNPTWGLDVKARASIHQHIRRARDRGCAVVFTSLAMDEVLELSDRVLVIFGGRIIVDAMSTDLNVSNIACAMVGKRADESADIAQSFDQLLPTVGQANSGGS